MREHAAWLECLPRAWWPQMADPAWQGASERFRPLVETLIAVHFPGCYAAGIGLFLLAAGQEHPAHTDEQAPDWVTRVHIPLVSNSVATATTADGTTHMEVGRAYRFNTKETHAVANRGTEPRVHLVFDVKKGHQLG